MGTLQIEMDSRHEPQTLLERSFPRDPYAAWLEQREAERDLQERRQIRWVQRFQEDRRGIVARRL